MIRKSVLVKKGGRGEGHGPFSWLRYPNIACVSSTNAFGLGRTLILVKNMRIYI